MKKLLAAMSKLGLLFKYLRVAYYEWLYTTHLKVRRLHDRTYREVNWYKGWTDKPYSSGVHKATVSAFVVALVISFGVQNILPGLFLKPKGAEAASHTVTWTTKEDFENNAVTTGTPTVRDSNIDTVGTDGSIKLKRTTEPLVEFTTPQIAAGSFHSIGLKSDGTVLAVGDNSNGQLGVGAWENIVQIAAGENDTVGLKADGKVLAVGSDRNGQLNVGDWVGITQISAGGGVTVGLTGAGTVVATGGDYLGTATWSGITQVAAGNGLVLGLKSNGTVVSEGYSPAIMESVAAWTDISRIFTNAASGSAFGLKDNGTVVAAGGNNEYGELNTDSWENITQIAVGFRFTLGLKTDGTVVSVGRNYEQQANVSDWANVTQISCGYFHSDGLTAIGTILGTGSSYEGATNFQSWNLTHRVSYPSTAVVSGLKFDAGEGVKADWANLSASVTSNEVGTSIGIMTRSSDDGITWPESWDVLPGSEVPSPSSRFLEILIRIGTENPLVTLEVQSIDLGYDTVDMPMLNGGQQTSFINETIGEVEINWGGFVSGKSSVSLRASMPSCAEGVTTGCHAEYEIKKTTQAYDGQNLVVGTDTMYFGDQSTVEFTPSGEYSYKWRVRSVHNGGMVSGWREYTEGTAFGVDSTAPTGRVTIENEAKFTKTQNVHLTISATDTESGLYAMRFSNDATNWSDWEAYGAGRVWNLGGSEGKQTVYSQFMDNAGNISGNTWQTKADFANSTSDLLLTGVDTTDFSSLGLSSATTNLTMLEISRNRSSYAYDGQNLYVTGRNTSGELGTGNADNLNTWAKTGISNVKKIAAGSYGAMILQNNGILLATGDNGRGTLGLGQGISEVFTWIETLSGVSDVWFVGSSALVKMQDGSYKITGSNNMGELALGDTNTRYNWTAVDLGSDIKNISLADQSIFVLYNDGILKGAGANHSGQLGIGINEDQNPHMSLETLSTDVLDIYDNKSRTIFIKKTNGKIYAAGENYNSQACLPSSYYMTAWTETPLTNVTEISARSHTLILKNDGSVSTCGVNDMLMPGIGSGDVTVPRDIGLSNVKSVSAGNQGSLILTNNGGAFGSGSNNAGELGIGNNDPQSTFIGVNPASYAPIGILGGDGSTVGLRYDAGVETKWTNLIPSLGVFDSGQSVKFAVKTSDDGATWSGAMGTDGQPIDWNSNFLGVNYDENVNHFDLSAIPASRYIDILVRLESTSNTPILKSVSVESAISDEIIVDAVGPSIAFDPNKKYPMEGWNVKENVNSIEFKFTTNKDTVAYINYGKDTPNTEAHGDAVYSSSHHIILKNLGSKSPYKYRIRAFDTLGNETMWPSNSADVSQAFTAGTSSPDTGFDGLPQVSSLSQVEITASTAKITWKTKVPTSSYIDFGSSAEYGETSGDPGLTTYHVIELKNLTAGLTYHYRVRGNDVSDNEFASGDFTFKAIMNPEISNVKVKEVSSYEATITWDTNVGTDSAVNYGAGLPYNSREYSDEKVNNHSMKLKNLADLSVYNYQIEARDEYANVVKTGNFTFSTPLDTEGPKIANVGVDVMPLGEAENSAQIIVSWVTSKPATSRIEYDEGVLGGSYRKTTIEDSSLNIAHTSIIKDLKPNASYHLRIVSKDKRGNETISSDYTIITPIKQKSILQLVIRALEETFAWTADLNQFFANISNRMMGGN